MRKARAAGLSLFVLAALGIAACSTGEAEQAAYEACLAAAKKDANVGKAAFASREASNIQGSAGDSGLRVNIPYELGGKKGLYQCIAEKQTDGTFKVTF
jgi:hypothetical protein